MFRFNWPPLTMASYAFALLPQGYDQPEATGEAPEA